jgi:hypothetical protein
MPFHGLSRRPLIFFALPIELPTFAATHGIPVA